MKLAIKALRSPNIEGIGEHIARNLPENVTPGGAPAPAEAAPAPAPGGEAAPAAAPKPRTNHWNRPELEGDPTQRPEIPGTKLAPAPAPGGEAAPAPGEGPTKYTIEELMGFTEPNENFAKPEQVREVFQRGQNAEQIQTELTAASGKVTELTEQLQSKLNPYPSDTIAEFAHFARETKNDNFSFFQQLKSTDLDKMDPIDVLLLEREQSSAPGDFSRTNAKAYLEQKHGLSRKPYTGKTDEENYEANKASHEAAEDSRIGINQEGLRMDANVARRTLKELKGHIVPMDLEAEQTKAIAEAKTKNDALSKEWEPHVNRVTEGLKKLSLTYPGEKGAIINLGEFEVPQQQIDHFRAEAQQLVIRNGKEANSDNIAEVEAVMKNMTLLANRNQIFEKIAKNARAYSEEEFEKLYSNPSGAEVGSPAPAPAPAGSETPKSGAELMTDSYKKHKQMILNGEV